MQSYKVDYVKIILKKFIFKQPDFNNMLMNQLLLKIIKLLDALLDQPL